MHNTPFFSPPEHEEGLGLQGNGLTAPIHHQLCFLTFFQNEHFDHPRQPSDHPDLELICAKLAKKIIARSKLQNLELEPRLANSLPGTTIFQKNNPEQLIAKYCFEQQFARFTKEISGVTLNNKKLSVTTFCKSSRRS